jgi:hypothetical protein
LKQGVSLQQLSPQLQLCHRLLRQPPNSLALSRRQFPRLEVNHAQGSERVAFSVDQRHAAIKTKVRFPGNNGEILETLVLRQVGYVEKVVRTNRGAADRHLARAFDEIGREAVFCFEPLATLINQADQRDWAAANLGGQFRQCVIGKLRRCIERSVER